MSQNNFPAGWDEDKMQRVLAHYEGQSDEDALLEDEAGVERSETVMNDLMVRKPTSPKPVR